MVSCHVADGIALGAAATTRADVEMIVFFAIMLHKVGDQQDSFDSIF
jgi:zinc transporter ZupT